MRKHGLIGRSAQTHYDSHRAQGKAYHACKEENDLQLTSSRWAYETEANHLTTIRPKSVSPISALSQPRLRIQNLIVPLSYWARNSAGFCLPKIPANHPFLWDFKA